MSDWDVSLPINHTKISDVPSEIRSVKSAAKVIFAKEHVEPAADNEGGQHVKGSARVYLQSAEPLLNPEGSSLSSSADNGRIVVLTSAEYKIKVYDAGWKLASVGKVVLDDDEPLDANDNQIVSLPVGTQSGNALAVQQLDDDYITITEPATEAKLKVIKADEATLWDGAGLGSLLFGPYENDSTPEALVGSAVYKAQRDILVFARAAQDTQWGLTAYVGDTNDPTTVVAIEQNPQISDIRSASIVFPVKMDQYFKVVVAGTTIQSYLYWGIGSALPVIKQ